MNHLNKILKTFALGSTYLLVISGCTDLNVEEQDSIVIEESGGGFVAGNPTELLAASYNSLDVFADQANIYSLSVHTSDEMLPPTRGVDWGDNGVWRLLHSHAWDPTHSYVLGAWNQLNERIFRTNQILASNPSPSEAAQSKFIRAYLMWHVLDFWGKVPFREVDEGVDVDPQVFSAQQAFDFIKKDLEDALAGLEDTGPSGFAKPVASQAAARHMLARLLLNKAVYLGSSHDAADMTAIITHAQAIAASGFSLEDEFFDNFGTSATTELIWTITAGSPFNRWNMTLHYDMNPSGWNGFTTVKSFYDKFEKQDQRIGFGPGTTDYVFDAADFGEDFDGFGQGFLIGQQYKDDGTPLVDSRSQKALEFTLDVPLAGAATEKGVRAIKFHPQDEAEVLMLRYADVYLMAAEAALRGGTGADALTMVNELRAKRGATQLTSVDEASMLDERGREMYWEPLRRTDQIRFGTFTGTWEEKTNTEAFRVLFPIPQQAMDSNPNLAPQNDGY